MKRTATHLLIRYRRGFLERATIQSPRSEGYLRAGEADDRGVVKLVADQVLGLSAYSQESLVVNVEPRGDDDTPYQGFDVGDLITADLGYGVTDLVRVTGFTVTEDDEGNPVFVPELNTQVELAEQRVQRLLERLQTDGTLGGTVRSAAPIGSEPDNPIPAGRLDAIQIPPFSQPGAIAVGESGRWTPDLQIRLTAWAIQGKADNATGTTTFRFTKNGVPYTLDPLSMTSTQEANITYLFGQDKAFTITDYLSVECTAAGGHEDCTITLQAAVAV